MNKRLQTTLLAAILLPVGLFCTGCNDQPSQPQDVNIVVHVPAPVVITREVQVRVPSEDSSDLTTEASLPAAPQTTSTTASALATDTAPAVDPISTALSPTSVEPEPVQTSSALEEGAAAATPAETASASAAVTDTLVAAAAVSDGAASEMPPADFLGK
jgi:hypothetical protein